MVYKNSLYIPNDEEIKNLVLNECHNRAYETYPRYEKNISAIKKEFVLARNEEGYCRIFS